jgi:hypothetical protein
MTVIPIFPAQLSNGNYLQLYPAHPEVGGFDVYIWDNDDCDGGYYIHVADMAGAFKLLRTIKAELRGRA